MKDNSTLPLTGSELETNPDLRIDSPTTEPLT